LKHRAHGGVRVGRVFRLIETPTWCDMVALVDEGPAGDAFLAEVDEDGSRLGLSIAFDPMPGTTVRYHRADGPDELCRNRVWLREVAVVGDPAYPDAYLYARGSLGSLATASK